MAIMVMQLPTLSIPVPRYTTDWPLQISAHDKEVESRWSATEMVEGCFVHVSFNIFCHQRQATRAQRSRTRNSSAGAQSKLSLATFSSFFPILNFPGVSAWCPSAHMSQWPALWSFPVQLKLPLDHWVPACSWAWQFTQLLQTQSHRLQLFAFLQNRHMVCAKMLLCGLKRFVSQLQRYSLPGCFTDIITRWLSSLKPPHFWQHDMAGLNSCCCSNQSIPFNKRLVYNDLS